MNIHLWNESKLARLSLQQRSRDLLQTAPEGRAHAQVLGPSHG